MVEKLVIVQTKLPEDVLAELKKKTGEKTTKEALAKAIDHYLECSNIEPTPKVSGAKKRRSGRLPVYLNNIFEQYKITASND
ncbi:hypothetical protein Arcve_1450 [Archaeoglobus veneficus SNP6]|uniref:Uncharacterized protein n=2 Tax=Archaeoglobus veneficus TaxID=58290 RepID=F2KNX6_ARCVS|nr:hypothetical protein Arcve_1450 [Archaeoglobus veneficus SNP6]